MNFEHMQFLNRDALMDPHIGDYWHEMFVPYFVIVDIKDDVYTILNFIKTSPNSAYIDNGDTWSVDYSKSMEVYKEWIEKKVKYSTMDNFVADVVRSERWSGIAQKWREYNEYQ
jgi:hypothetical protein